jgi:putative hemolysin
MPMHELADVLDLDELPGGDQTDYQTLGGMVMTVLGRIPSKGDSFEHAQRRFEVVDMRGKRVHRVWVSPPLPEANESVR